MVIEVGSEKKSELVKDDQAYHLSGFTPTEIEINETNNDPDEVEPSKKGRRCGCGYISGLLIFILLGSSLYLGVEVARMKKMRGRYERPLLNRIDSLFAEDGDDDFMDNTKTSFSDFDKIPKGTWIKIANRIKKCIILKDMVPTDENVVGKVEPNDLIGGKENDMEMNFKDNYEVDCECLKNMVMDNKGTAREFLLKIKRPNNSKPQYPPRCLGGPGSDDADGDDLVQPFRSKRPNLTDLSSFPNDKNRRGQPGRPGSDGGPADVELNQPTKPYRPLRPHRPYLTNLPIFLNGNNHLGQPGRPGSDCSPGDVELNQPTKPYRPLRPHRPYLTNLPIFLNGNNHRGQPGRPGSDGSSADDELDRPHQANRPDFTGLPSFLIDPIRDELPGDSSLHGPYDPDGFHVW